MAAALHYLTVICALSFVSGYIKVPLTRHQSNLVAEPRRGNEFSVPTEDLFFGTVEIGNDKQEFKVLLDTGSSQVLIPSSECGYECGTHARHTCPGPSEGFSQVVYGTGASSASVCTDSLTIGGHKIKHQKMFLAGTEDSQLERDTFDGVVGLGYKKLAPYVTLSGEIQYARTILDGLAADHGIKKVFSAYLTGSQSGSFILFGGSDNKHYTGELQYQPVSKTGSIYDRWQVKMSSFNFGGTEYLDSSHDVVIDTGTSDLLFPTEVYNDIVQKLGGISKHSTFPCELLDSAPTFTIQIGEIELELGREYYAPETSEGKCTLLVTDPPKRDFSDFYVLGMPMFFKYYVEFDMEKNRIGFAPSK